MIAAAGMLGPRWGGARRWRAFPACISALTGAYLFGAGAAGLGRQLTPFPKPVEQSSLKQGGAYRFVRHPIYGGVLLLGLAWALVSSPVALLPWAAAGAFLDAKRRREEASLMEAPRVRGLQAERARLVLPVPLVSEKGRLRPTPERRTSPALQITS